MSDSSSSASHSSMSSLPPDALPELWADEPAAVLQIQPKAFNVDVRVNEDVFLDLELVNISSSVVVFKVKTTAKKRYLLRPTADIILPGATKIVKIVLTPMSSLVELGGGTVDKFLVQAMPIRMSATSQAIALLANALPNIWKERENVHAPKEGKYAYSEFRIKCKLTPQNANANANPPANSPNHDRFAATPAATISSVQPLALPQPLPPAALFPPMPNASGSAAFSASLSAPYSAALSASSSVSATPPHSSSALSSANLSSSPAALPIVGPTESGGNAGKIDSALLPVESASDQDLRRSKQKSSRYLTGGEAAGAATSASPVAGPIAALASSSVAFLQSSSASSLSSASASVTSQFSRLPALSSVSSSQGKDYDELMDCLVQLTAQLERQKSELEIEKNARRMLEEKFQLAIQKLSSQEKKLKEFEKEKSKWKSEQEEYALLKKKAAERSKKRKGKAGKDDEEEDEEDDDEDEQDGEADGKADGKSSNSAGTAGSANDFSVRQRAKASAAERSGSSGSLTPMTVSDDDDAASDKSNGGRLRLSYVQMFFLLLLVFLLGRIFAH